MVAIVVRESSNDGMQSGWWCTVWIVVCGLEVSNGCVVLVVVIVVRGLDDSDRGVRSGW